MLTLKLLEIFDQKYQEHSYVTDTYVTTLREVVAVCWNDGYKRSIFLFNNYF